MNTARNKPSFFGLSAYHDENDSCHVAESRKTRKRNKRTETKNN